MQLFINILFGSGRPLDLAPRTTTLVISSEETKDILKIVKSLEESGVLTKGVTETIEKEVKK